MSMVEVAGIEPASKEQNESKSTCVVIFNLEPCEKDNQNCKTPAYGLRQVL